MMKKGIPEGGFNLMFVRYVTACVTFGVTLVAMVPTMSRAGWIGALVGVMLLYRREVVAWGNTRRRWVIGGGIVGMIVVLMLFLPVKERFGQRTAFYLAEYGVCLLENSLYSGLGLMVSRGLFAEAQHDYFEKRRCWNRTIAM